MFEKEAEEYAERHAFRVPYDGSNKFYDDNDYECSKEGFQKGAEFGYNKANEWHYMKEEKPKDNEYVLIYTNIKNVYIARLVEDDYFITYKGGFVQMSAVIAWKEIVLPKESV